MSDSRYFSEEFANYVSNSKLKLIDPWDGGTVSRWKAGFIESSNSLSLGSHIHELCLQPESFILAIPKSKPSAKLGDVIDRIKSFRKEGLPIYDSIIEACHKANYNVNRINDKLINSIIEKGFSYYWNTRNDEDNVINLSEHDWYTCNDCVKSITNNRYIQQKLHPMDMFAEYLPTFNEEAFFIDFYVEINNTRIKIPFKMKADNWTYDPERKRIVLNDLKTTSKEISLFMGNSFAHYHYARQMAAYGFILMSYLRNTELFVDKSWTFEANMLVVETMGWHDSECFKVHPESLRYGLKEFIALLKVVGWYEYTNWEKDYEFEKPF